MSAQAASRVTMEKSEVISYSCMVLGTELHRRMLPRSDVLSAFTLLLVGLDGGLLVPDLSARRCRAHTESEGAKSSSDRISRKQTLTFKVN